KHNAGAADLQLAFADYYRAKRLPSSMSRYLKDLKNEPQAALIEGLALLQEDDGADKALPKLKTALAGSPQSARIHYRLAVAHLALKDEASARAGQAGRCSQCGALMVPEDAAGVRILHCPACGGAFLDNATWDFLHAHSEPHRVIDAVLNWFKSANKP